MVDVSADLYNDSAFMSYAGFRIKQAVEYDVVPKLAGEYTETTESESSVNFANNKLVTSTHSSYRLANSDRSAGKNLLSISGTSVDSDHDFL
jgi:hypothetical protein